MVHSRAMSFYRVNRPDVVMESFEGETVLVHMKRGNYYSLQGSAPLIWEMIDRGCSVEETGSYLTAQYPGRDEEIIGSVRNLAEELIAEDLIVPLADSPSPASTRTLPKIEKNGSFTSPVLERYTDMQELLLLDPIHDVDETGWPRRKVEEEK